MLEIVEQTRLLFHMIREAESGLREAAEMSERFDAQQAKAEVLLQEAEALGVLDVDGKKRRYFKESAELVAASRARFDEAMAPYRKICASRGGRILVYLALSGAMSPAPSRALDAPSRNDSTCRASRRIGRVFDLVEVFVPKRVASEEIGDAMELITTILEGDRPVWHAYAKMVSTLVFVVFHAVQYAWRGPAKQKN